MAQRSKVINAGFFKVFPQKYDEYMEFVTKKNYLISYLINPQNVTSKNDKLKIIEINREYGNIFAENIAICFIALLHKVRSSEVDDFKKMIAHQLSYLKSLNAPWPAKEDDIINIINLSNERMKVLVQEEIAILGNLSQAKSVEEQHFREQYRKQGFTDAQIDKLLQKMYDVSRKRAKLQATQARLKEQQRKVREKFAPQVNDSDDILWRKMIALKKCYLPEDALSVLALVGKNQDKTIPDKVCRVAEKVLQHPQDLPFVHGIVVCFFEAPATGHAIFQPGDVIVNVNGNPCLDYKDFRSAEGVKYILYRLDDKGEFKKLVLVMPENQPRTAVGELPF